MKKLLVLAAGSVAICLQFGTSMAFAEEVCIDGDTVTGIKNLEVVTYQYGTINIDVAFKYATGYEIYGSLLDKFPFEGFYDGEDANATRTAIENALNNLSAVPGSAGQAGQTAYFIGIEKEDIHLGTFVGAIGSENLTGNEWDTCTSVSDCYFLGIATLDPNERFTYADLSRADGSSCDNTHCNVNTVSGVTEYAGAEFEACEILILGPDFIAADGSSVSVSAGWEIDFMPGFIVEQGATLNASVCGQSLCMTSPSPMPFGCHSCINAICTADAWCCTNNFDSICLNHVDTVCGLVCE